MSKINDYLPKVLQPIVEFQQINSDLDIELNNIDEQIKNIEKEVIVQTATEYGIGKWENTLGIIPSDSDSLEVRRFRISNILTSKLPYTVRWLRQKLTEIVGTDNGWTLNIDNNNYTITIVLSGLDTKLMLEVEKQLRNAIPSNMGLVIGGAPITSSEIRFGIAMLLAVKNKITSGYRVVEAQNLITNDILKNWISYSDNPNRITFDEENKVIAVNNIDSNFRLPKFTSDDVSVPSDLKLIILENSTKYNIDFGTDIAVSIFGVSKSNGTVRLLAEYGRGYNIEYETYASHNSNYKGIFIGLRLVKTGLTQAVITKPIVKSKNGGVINV